MSDFFKKELKDDGSYSVESSPIDRYSRVQWHGGGVRGSKGVLKDGGWNIPVDSLTGGVYSDSGLEVVTFPYQDGTEGESYLFDQLGFCIVGKVITAHSHYDSFLGSTRLWKNPKNIPQGVETTFKVWAYCYISEMIPHSNGVFSPFILSLARRKAFMFTSYKEESLGIYPRFKNEVVGVYNKLKRQAGVTGSPTPPYAFWLQAKSSGVIKTKFDKFTINSADIIPAWDDNIHNSTLEDYKALEDLSVYEELINHIQAEGLEEAKAWHDDMEALFEDGKQDDRNMTQLEAIQGMNSEDDNEGYDPDLDDNSEKAF